MENIRKATLADLSRISEIFIFNNRINYYPIFQDEEFSFKTLNVFDFAEEIKCKIGYIYVFDDGIVRGFMEYFNTELVKLYVDPSFQKRGIGDILLTYGMKELGIDNLWTLEKNTKAISFYQKHNFIFSGKKKYEQDTSEKLVEMIR